ncbi:RNA-directed DNA polymerase, eukaryota [Tanacetum coccineum]
MRTVTWMKKLKYLKQKIRDWNKGNMKSSKNIKAKLKDDLKAVDDIIDNGEGNDEVVKLRMDVLKSIQDIDKIQSLDAAQKAKIKWSIEGDENSSFYHGVLNKKWSQLNIRGILVDGIWVDNPQRRLGLTEKCVGSKEERWIGVSSLYCIEVRSSVQMGVEVLLLKIHLLVRGLSTWTILEKMGSGEASKGPRRKPCSVSDRWKWSLENSGDFSVASVNVHAWKVKIDSLPTRFNISRRGMDIESITCSICDNEVESSSHLFFKCNMVRDIIRKITRWWDITYIDADLYEDWLNWLVNLRLSSNYKQALEGVFYVKWACLAISEQEDILALCSSVADWIRICQARCAVESIMEPLGSYADWLNWFNSIRLSSKVKDLLEGVLL